MTLPEGQFDSLPRSTRRLLGLVSNVVPARDRVEWLRTWQAELWHARFGQHRPLGSGFFADLSVGLTVDALWLRRQSWREAYGGTARFCLFCLAALCGLAMLIAADLIGAEPRGWQSLLTLLTHSLFATPLVLFVASATGWRYASGGGGRRTLPWMRRTFFLGSKTALTLGVAALVSADLFLPFYGMHRGMSDVLQQLFFVLLGLIGLRWSFADQAERCKDCLRSLTSPERVGRPSHNLLEWAGTEQVCIHGHGALSSPEMVSSWCEHSRWVDRPAGWDGAVSVS
jgi:hypothetical protein